MADEPCGMIPAAGPVRAEPTEIRFGNGNRAVLLQNLGADSRELLADRGRPHDLGGQLLD